MSSEKKQNSSSPSHNQLSPLHQSRDAARGSMVQGQGVDKLLQPDPMRLAFIDPEFLLRRENRGVRLQLELIKPDLELSEQGVEQTVVMFGSARIKSPEELSALQAKYKTAPTEDLQRLIARTERNLKYYEMARDLAARVVKHCDTLPLEQRMTVCTGGGPGIMEAANRGAQEAGGRSVGLNIVLPHEQAPNTYITPSLCFNFHYFAIRKLHFVMRAQALIAFPGGFGTLDELFEVLTLVQCRKSNPVPIILFGRDYWQRVINFDVMVEEGAISPEDLDLFRYCETAEEAMDAIFGAGAKQ